MHKKIVLTIAITIIALTNLIYAEKVDNITVTLKAPHRYNTPMTEKEPKVIYEVSSIINITVDKEADAEYTIEYYINGNLVYTVTGENGYNYKLDTTTLENGIHKITVNYYKTNAERPEMLLGTQKIMVKNETN